MSDSTPNDKIDLLEQRHIQLIEELDVLNQRLEQTLSSFSKTSDKAPQESD